MKWYCKNCGKEKDDMPYIAKKRKYCNSSCQMVFEYKTGKRSGSEVTKAAHHTLRTKGHYKRDNSYLKNGQMSIEARKKMSKDRKGRGNPMYGKPHPNRKDKGRLKRIYVGSYDWRKQRKKALLRDEYVCQGCDIHEEESYQMYNCALQVHHIKPFRYGGTHELDNLITLCVKCHAIETQKELKIYKNVSEVHIQ